MSKISELGTITGNNTRSEDLFVTVNLVQGDDGTKNITRKELVNAIQQEIFADIKVDGGDYIKNVPIDIVTINNSTIDNSTIANSTINDSTINDATIEDPNINVTTAFTSPIAEDDYFYLKDVSLGTTVAISYSQLYNEIAESAKKAKKIYVDVNGSDTDSGSYLKPVQTLEKAVEMAWAASQTVTPGVLERQTVNITVNPGTYYTYGELALPDFCSMTSSTGQYTTTIVMREGYEKKNCILVGNGCYVQGFSFFNLEVDNFDYPTTGFAFAFRPGTRFTRSPYVRDCSQISNYLERDNPPLLNPFNSRGTIEDLGFELTVSNVLDSNGNTSPVDFEVGDSIETTNGVTGYISRVDEIGSGTIYVRNNIGNFEANTTITTSSGGTAKIEVVGEEDFPNKEVGRGGGMIIADRAACDTDSIFTYFLCFGATPRTQNGLGYVAKNGAGINGISSLSIFSRCAFYALDGGQISLNNSGTQFGDISMRAKGSTPIFNPRETTANTAANTVLSEALIDNANNIIEDLMNNYITANTSVGGLGLQEYDSVKCARDTGYILEGIGLDVALGTNYWAVINGIAYRRAESSVVIDEQLVETAGAIRFLANTVIEILEENGDAAARAESSFNEVIDILENGSASADVLIFSNTGVANHKKAKDLLVANKTLIQNSIISYISTNYPSLTYDESLCRRDTGYIVDALSHDLNYDTNLATMVNAEAYFVGTASTLPTEQIEPTASAFGYLGDICSQIMLGTFSGQSTASGVASQTEADKVKALATIIEEVIRNSSLQELPGMQLPDFSWVETKYVNAREVIEANIEDLKKKTVGFVNATYNFIDGNLTRRDARNLITSFASDFRFGRQTASRIFVISLHDFKGNPVFSVFNPQRIGLNYIGSYTSTSEVDATTVNVDDAIIVYTGSNIYDGTVYYSDGTSWISDGANDIDLLNAFTGSWSHMRDYIKTNITTSAADEAMLDGLVDDVLIQSIQDPIVIRFGSLVESLSHQFNLASAGVNVNALPLNFRRLGRPISAAASISQEDGGRVRWSGADELNNQYFAQGLRINGRTGRLEGRPFTSSVRKLARRASNSRALIS